MTEPIRILHIGAGERSFAFFFPVFRYLTQRGVVRIVAVATRDASRAAQLKSRGFETTHEWRRLLHAHNADAVTVAVAPEAMAGVIESLLPYHIPIYHETPLGRPVGSASRLIRRIRASGVPVATSEQHIYTPLEQLRRKVVQDGHIGRIETIVNLHHTWSYHGVAKIRSYLPQQPLERLRAWARPVHPLGKEILTLFEFAESARAYMVFGAHSKGIPYGSAARSFLVIGERGVVSDDAVHIYEGTHTVTYPLRAAREGGILHALRYENDERTLASWKNPYRDAPLTPDQIALAFLLENFVNAVRRNTTPPYSAEESYLDLLATQAMEFSSHLDGIPVSIDTLAPRRAYFSSITKGLSASTAALLISWLVERFARRSRRE